MVTLQAIYDQSTAENPFLIRTQEDMDELVERVRTASAGHPCPTIVEITNAENPFRSPVVNAGIGADRGFVHENWHPQRATQGDPDATGVVVYDVQGNAADIPAIREVPLHVVREVLAAHLAGNGQAPEDSPDLHIVS
ncbi:Imm1 family immunity protein [Actinosynnema sp. NPDC023587]|uniref:Imm1 family immunity protein n=1 Tax=Actinosynnema sp. NPDC023587 TaxID=3154695 RepID=UPI0033D45CE5